MATGLELLRRVPLFERLDDDQLAWLAGRAVATALAPGEVLVREGDPADAMYVVVEGALEATKLEGTKEVRLGVFGRGEPLGELALVARRNRSATVRALQPSNLLRLDERVFEELLETPAVARQILQTILGRVESQEARLRQHAKMAALGTVTAGLLHDLNNPAAAVRATVRRLGEVLAAWRSLAVEVAGAAPEVAAGVRRLRDGAGAAPPAGSLARSDREEALLDWLEARGVAGAWRLAPPLADLGLEVADLDRLAAEVGVGELELAASWLALDSQVEQLLADATRGADHIAEVTRRAKGYSRVDEAPIGDVDVREGFETVLALLRSKLGDVVVEREFADDLPSIEGYPADLNEAWLNLVDNALDALGGSGRLVLRATATDGGVVVEVSDDGPGIPPGMSERIFEPFFTTKPPGSGTGLGLAQVYRIVVSEHGGDVDVSSRPGRTVFRVELPRQLPPGYGDRAMVAGAEDELAGSDL